MIDVILIGHSKIIEYGSKLVADLSDEQMILQPEANMNHPAWILSHLNLYLPVMQHLMKGEEFPDPRDHTFGMKSKPETNPSLYAGRKELASEFKEGNEGAARLLQTLGEEALKQPVRLQRWQESMPISGMALGYIMLAHQGIHLGQLSAWRRAAGLPPV
ncbi:MAG: DinB family protein [Leptospiraceae bacterium]